MDENQGLVKILKKSNSLLQESLTQKGEEDYIEQAKGCLLENDLGKARRYLDDCLYCFPDSIEGHELYNIAELKFCLDKAGISSDYDKEYYDPTIAEELLREADIALPEDADIKAALGRAYLEQLREDIAIEHLEEAREMDKDNYRIAQGLCQAYGFKAEKMKQIAQKNHARIFVYNMVAETREEAKDICAALNILDIDR